jgi:protein tyrosine phosphatase
MKSITKLLILTALISLSAVSAGLLKSTPAKSRCYADYGNFKKIENDDACKNLSKDSSKFAEIKKEDITKFQACLNIYHYVEADTKEKQLEIVGETCTKQNRFDGIFSYDKHTLTTTEGDYLNSSKYAGRLKLKGDEYTFNHEADKAKGFIAATNAPIGDYKEAKKLVDHNEKAFPSCKGNENFSKKVSKQQDGKWKIDEAGKEHEENCVSGVIDDKGGFKKDNTIHQFYKTLVANKINYVVMLTNFVEDFGKDAASPCKCQVKADPYFSLKSGDFVIRDAKREKESGATVTTVFKDDKKNILEFFGKADYKNGDVRELIYKEGGKEHKITHIHFRGWLDSAVPSGEDADALVNLIKKIKTLIDANAENNVIVHCTAGTGRTGTFISSVLALDAKPAAGKKFDLPKFILELRKQRPEFVKTENQVEFIVNNILKKNASRKLKK